MGWSFLDNFTYQAIHFIVGIILARLLAPSDFGLVGMLAIFMAISQTFIDSGLSQALIRKQDCNEEDFHTVFYFNLFVAIILYIALFLTAPWISSFFNEPQLIKIVRVMSIVLVLGSLGLVQRTKLTKLIDIKTQTIISAISGIISGAIAVYLAFRGFGVWSLVWRLILFNLISSALLWLGSKWHIKLIFSGKSFKEMFSFGSKLLASGLLNTVFENAYYVIIGKFFSPQLLGYYTRAVTFANLPSSNIDSVVQRVSYPVLSTFQNNLGQMREAFRKLIKSTMLITFTLMIGLAAAADQIILVLIGDKWEPAAPLLRLLCFALILYPLHSLNLNILKVMGRSDIFLKVEIIKKITVIPVFFLGIFLGIKIMILGMIIHSVIALFINVHYSGNMIQYPIKEQLVDLFPSFIIALSAGSLIYLTGCLIQLTPFALLIIQAILGGIVIIGLCEALKLEHYKEIKRIFMFYVKSILGAA